MSCTPIVMSYGRSASTSRFRPGRYSSDEMCGSGPWRLGRDEAALDGDRPHAALGAAAVVRDRGVGDMTALVQAGPHRGHDQPVAQPQRPEREGLEQHMRGRRRRPHVLNDRIKQSVGQFGRADARDAGSAGAHHAPGFEGHRVRAARRAGRLRRDLVAVPSDGLGARLGVDRGHDRPGALPAQPARVLRAAGDDGRGRRGDVADQGRRVRDGHDPPPPGDARPGHADRGSSLRRAARSSASARASA